MKPIKTLLIVIAALILVIFATRARAGEAKRGITLYGPVAHSVEPVRTGFLERTFGGIADSWNAQDDWTTGDKVALGAFLLGQAADVYQYNRDSDLRDGGYLKESNGKITDASILPIKILFIAGAVTLAHFMPQKARKWVLWPVTAYQTTIIINNEKVRADALEIKDRY